MARVGIERRHTAILSTDEDAGEVDEVHEEF